jgi:hypothetical protein
MGRAQRKDCPPEPLSACGRWHPFFNQVRRHAAERGYTFAGPVAVDPRPAPDGTTLRFRIHSRITPAEGSRSPWFARTWLLARRDDQRHHRQFQDATFPG